MSLRQATVTLSVLLALALPAFSEATVLPQSPVDPEPTTEKPPLPGPEAVPGKEYSTDTDTNAAGGPALGQVVHWQGDGKTVWDSFKITWPSGAGGPGIGGPIGEQIDALANVRDLYFQDVVADRIPLLVSLKNSKDIYAARSSVMGGNAILWAKWDTQINNKLGAIDDIDALEVWGPDDSDDADMYSWKGDPAFGGERISIWRYHPGTDTSVPYLRTSVLLDHLITDDGNKVDWNYWDANLVDLSNLMVWDNGGDDDSFNESYVLTRSGAVELRKDMILFGVKPIPGLFDGGEIWVYTFGDDKAQFLVQGLDGNSPRVWNTANNVGALFGLPTEEIDALEALPEPMGVWLLALGGLSLLRRRNHPRR